MQSRSCVQSLCATALLLLVLLGSLVVLPTDATMYLASSTNFMPIRPFSKLLEICQSVNAQGTVVALTTAAKKKEANTLMTGEDVGKVFVSATFDTAAAPPDYYWVDTEKGVTTRTLVATQDFTSGTRPAEQLLFVLYSTDPALPGLIPYSGVSDYAVLCVTDDPTFTTPTPSTSTTPPTGGGATPSTTSTVAPSDKKKGSSFPWWAILILVLGIVALLVVAMVVVCCCCFECVMEDDLAEQTEGAESDSPQFRSHDNRSFADDSRDSRSSPTRKGHAEGTVAGGGTSCTGVSSHSGSSTTDSSSVFSDGDTYSSCTTSEASVTNSSDSDDGRSR